LNGRLKTPEEQDNVLESLGFKKVTSMKGRKKNNVASVKSLDYQKQIYFPLENLINK